MMHFEEISKMIETVNIYIHIKVLLPTKFQLYRGGLHNSIIIESQNSLLPFASSQIYFLVIYDNYISL
jgi:hypothetical protein